MCCSVFLRAVYSLADSPSSCVVDFRTASHSVDDDSHLLDDPGSHDPPGNKADNASPPGDMADNASPPGDCTENRDLPGGSLGNRNVDDCCGSGCGEDGSTMQSNQSQNQLHTVSYVDVKSAAQSTAVGVESVNCLIKSDDGNGTSLMRRVLPEKDDGESSVTAEEEQAVTAVIDWSLKDSSDCSVAFSTTGTLANVSPSDDQTVMLVELHGQDVDGRELPPKLTDERSNKTVAESVPKDSSMKMSCETSGIPQPKHGNSADHRMKKTLRHRR